jgi:release factor glutamine methyltransferase
LGDTLPSVIEALAELTATEVHRPLVTERMWNLPRTSYLDDGKFGAPGDEHAGCQPSWLLSDVTGLSRVELYTNYDRPLESDELSAMREAIKRRVAGEPLQYVTGETAFRHIVVRCEREVLIPRPETELLVEYALEELPRSTGGQPLPALVLELGTGTGCIACSLAHERAKTHVIATDVSPEAVALATKNCRSLGLTPWVEIRGGDLAADVDRQLMGHFDLLVSNPPYIPSEVVEQLPYEVRGFEPHRALDGGSDGLVLYRRILELAPQVLRPGGAFAVELFETTLDQAAHLAHEQGGWASVEIRSDLTHRPRFLIARRQS